MGTRPVTPKRQGMGVRQSSPTSADLQTLIAQAAYYRAERRGFTPGGEVEDWLAAEAEILSHIEADDRVRR